MQQEITQPLPLLNDKGHIIREGWARHPYWQYDRSAIKAPWYRIKEWDYYSVFSADGQFGISITVSDLGYLGLMSVGFLDMSKAYFHQVEDFTLLPHGKTGLGTDSDTGTVVYRGKKMAITYVYSAGERRISIVANDIEDTKGNKGLQAEITLQQPPEMESMNIATSWKENRRAFYYNRKINCMPADGFIQIGSHKLSFHPSNDFGALDWGRGVWTYKNRWYWGSGSGYVEGKPFGFNIGYGFSDRTPASENMLFFDGIAHKLAEVTFHIDTTDYMKPWRFSSSDGRFEMDFLPLVDRAAKVNLGLVRTDQHQVFGYFNGTAILDDGRKLVLKDFFGFAEDVFNMF
jgi:hypothetical protein